MFHRAFSHLFSILHTFWLFFSRIGSTKPGDNSEISVDSYFRFSLFFSSPFFLFLQFLYGFSFGTRSCIARLCFYLRYINTLIAKFCFRCPQLPSNQDLSRICFHRFSCKDRTLVLHFLWLLTAIWEPFEHFIIFIFFCLQFSPFLSIFHIQASSSFLDSLSASCQLEDWANGKAVVLLRNVELLQEDG